MDSGSEPPAQNGSTEPGPAQGSEKDFPNESHWKNLRKYRPQRLADLTRKLEAEKNTAPTIADVMRLLNMKYSSAVIYRAAWIEAHKAQEAKP